MKQFLTILLLFSTQAFAADKYVSSVSGNDGNAGTFAAPYASITKVNNILSTLSNGDSVLFKAGETFVGNLIMAHSSINFGRYGTGSNPVITSMVNVTGWVNIGNNVWQSAVNSSLGATVTTVTRNSWLCQLGRYPNASDPDGGYLRFESHNLKLSITDNNLSVTPSWAGAGIVVRPKHFVTEIRTVGSHSGGTLTFTSPLEVEPDNGGGYFFQNSLQTLDLQNEWYYNPTSQRLYIKSSTIPTNIQASTGTHLVTSTNFSSVKFRNISFVGANSRAFHITGGGSFDIQNCYFKYVQRAIFSDNGDNHIFKFNVISNAMGDAIVLNDGSGFVIQDNYIDSTFMWTGMGATGNDFGGYGIKLKGSTPTVQRNIIKHNGYTGIRINGTNTLCQYNLVDGFCLKQRDGAGIYTVPSEVLVTGQIISDNIVVNGIPTADGGIGTAQQTYGIYIDNNSSNNTVQRNTVSNLYGGIYSHRGNLNYFLNNTIYNCTLAQLIFKSDNTGNQLIRNDVIKNNIFFAKTTAQSVYYLETVNNDIQLFGLFDSNYICRPIFEPNNIANAGSSSTGGVIRAKAGVTSYWSLGNNPAWKISYAPYEAASKKTYKGYDTLRFEYNASTRDSIVILNDPINGLPYTYVNAKGTRFKGTLTLLPYTSEVLIRDTAVPTATPNAKPLVTLTLPANGATYTTPASVTWSATASDPDGTISSVKLYNGNNLIDFDNSSPYTKVLLGLGVGGYALTAHATDNAGDSTISNTVNITITAANIPPTVSITLPLDSSYFTTPADVDISVSAADADGTISSVKLYNGSTLITTLTDSPYTYTWAGQTTGDYNLYAVAFDNSGDSTTSTVIHFFVNEAPPLEINTTQGNILCNGGTTTVTVSGTGGTAPYSGDIGDHTESAGTHTYIIEDALGAKDTAVIVLTGPALLTASAVTGTIATYGGTTTATISSTGGTAPKTYRLTKNGIATAWQASNVFTITAGSYLAEVTDANNCTASTNFSVTQPIAPSSVIIHGKGKKHRYVNQ